MQIESIRSTVAVTVLHLLTKSTDGGNNPISYAAWAKACDFAADPAKARSRTAWLALQDTKRAETALTLSFAALARAAIIDDANESIALSAIAAAAASTASDSLSKLETETLQNVEAAAVTSRRRGHIEETLTILRDAASNSGWCINIQSNGATAAKDTKLNQCTDKLLTLTAAENKLGSTKITSAGFSGLPRVQSHLGTSNTDENKCLLTKAGDSGNTNTIQKNKKLMGGILKFTGDGDAELIAHNSGKTPQTRPGGGKEIIDLAHHLLSALESRQTTQAEATTQDFINNIATETAIKPIIADLAVQTGLSKNDDPANQMAEGTLKRIAGNAGANIKKLWITIQNTPIDKQQAEKSEANTVAELNTPAKLIQYLSYKINAYKSQIRLLQAEHAKLKAEAKNGKKEVKSIEKTCNEKTDSEKCNDDKNCKYDETKKEGPKCVLSEKSKKEAEKREKR
ncbi:variant surface glycoprotein [Trypanosoma brucei equiperdum]|uniref:Variant surface glycoprotein n=1 Tax=Trypanosoma brucei equiperdum TaxID=630700 RepID=A0A3L6KZC1_9TRYP|nr:variant surface glycoprotein [Trypanosoma brucei equiperdum]